MKTNFLLSILALALAFSSCKKEELPISNTGLNLKTLESNLHHEMQGNCVQYTYTVMKAGETVLEGAGGIPNPEILNPASEFTHPDAPKGAQSASKTITAVALVKALSENRVSLDAYIVDYLPLRWEKDSSFYDITFREVMNHRSGIRGEHTTFADLKAYTKAGTSGEKVQDYCNTNYSFCRILLAYVIDAGTMNTIEATLDDAAMATASSNLYINYIKDNLFKPNGHQDKVYTHSSINYIYDFENQTKLGKKSGEYSNQVGAGGWTLSSRTYAQFVNSLFVDKSYVSNSMLSTMQSSSLGMWRYNGKTGSYYFHNGSSVYGQACWMAFPEDVIIVIMVNSYNNSWDTASGTLARALVEMYEEAYVL